MLNTLYIIAIILTIGWLVGFVAFNAAVGSFIHLFLIIAILAAGIQLIGGSDKRRINY